MPSDLIDAASELRAAVRELARRTTTLDLDAETLRATAAQVQALAEGLDAPLSPPWWDGPVAAGTDDRRSYRQRSMYQGALHPFSQHFEWHAGATGPAGQDALGFEVTIPALFGGPPHAVHGGYVAGLFDELLGAVQGTAEGGGGYTGRLEVRYRALTPVEQPLVFTGWITTVSGRRIETLATCRHGDTLCAEAKGLFVRPAGGL